MGLVNKAISILKNDGLLVFSVRLKDYSLVKLKKLFLKQYSGKENFIRWQQLKNKYEGQRIFIIGNGPSLNKTELYFLKDEYTMAFNRFNLMFERLNWDPSFYVVTDDLVIKDMYNEINNEILNRVEYAFFPDLHPSNVDFTKLVDNRDNVYWLNSDKSEYRSDLPNCGINKTVVNAGMQIAAYLGFKEIYLLGVDMTFEDQKVKKINSRNWESAEHDPNHFDPRYFGKGRKYHNPTVAEMLERFEAGKIFFENLGVKVFNAGVNGKLEVFPRKGFNQIFNYNEEELDTLLNETKILKDQKLTFKDVFQRAVKLEGDATDKSIFKTDVAAAQSIIPKVINDYVPIGPYKQEYIFVKRNIKT